MSEQGGWTGCVCKCVHKLLVCVRENETGRERAERKGGATLPGIQQQEQAGLRDLLFPVLLVQELIRTH